MAEISKKKRRYIRDNCEKQSPAELAENTGIDEEKIRNYLTEELGVKFTPLEQQGDEAGFPRMFARFAGRFEWYVVGGMVAVYVVYFFTLCVLKWRAYTYGDFDLAIFNQGVWSAATFKGFFSCSIRFGYVFTDHLPFILIGAVPLYWLFGWFIPGPLILLFLQTAALGGAAIPLYLLARREVGKVMGLFIAAAYLLYPALGYMNLFEFHPGVLAVFFLPWAFYFLHVRRWRLFIVFMALSLACREDIAIPVFFLGLFALFVSWRRKLKLADWKVLKWTVVPCATGLIYLIIAIKLIVPAFNTGGVGRKASPFVQLYSYLVVSPEDFRTSAGFDMAGYREAVGKVTAVEVVFKILSSPFECLSKASRIERKFPGLYTLHLLAPGGGLPLLAPHALAIALPTYFQNLLARKWEPTTIFYQYTANITPFIFIALILGTAWLRRFPSVRRQSIVIASYVLVASIFTSGLWGKQLHPVRDPYGIETALRGSRDFYLQGYSNNLDRDDIDEMKDGMLSKLSEYEREKPDGGKASVIASFDFLTHVPLRPELYSWHYVKSGRDPITGEEVETPQVDYALLCFYDRLTFQGFTGERSGALQRRYLAGGGWKVLHQVDGTVMLERGTGSGDVSMLAAVVDGPVRVRRNQPRFVSPGGGGDTGLRLVSSEIIPEKTQIFGKGERDSLRVVCHYAIDERLQARGVSQLVKQYAVFEVGGPRGQCYMRGWPIAYTLIDPVEWPRQSATGPQRTVRVSYPLLLPEDSPPGRYSVKLSIRSHIMGEAYSAANLGAVTLK